MEDRIKDLDLAELTELIHRTLILNPECRLLNTFFP